MIRIFKWWWAWNYTEIEEWLERMEAGGLRLVETRCEGIFFYFEKCQPTKARYCVDYQTKLTPDYLTLISDDSWRLYQVGMGWYILRKEYDDERPDLYTDFEGLIARNKTLLATMAVLTGIEVISLGSMIYNTYQYPSRGMIALTAVICAVVVSLFAFIITNLSLQIIKFSNKNKN